MDQAPAFVIALLVILAATHAGGWLARLLRQPPVIGEMAAGLLLSPAIAGAVMPSWHQAIFAPAAVADVSRLGTLAVVVFMFVVGSTHAEADGAPVRTGAAVIAAACSLTVPFVLGVMIASRFYPAFAGPTATWPVFAMFLGTALSVTAFPVLARILSSFAMLHSPIGQLALRSAALGDLAAWCMLAVVTAITRGGGAPWLAVVTAAGFAAAMTLILRPVMAFILPRAGAQGGLLILGAGLAASAFSAESAGLHAVLGGFLFGAAVPPRSAIVTAWRPRIERASAWLMPAFFGVTGLKVSADAFAAGVPWTAAALVIAAAFAGKIGGAYVGGRAAGVPRPDALSLGILMNARGLVEIVVIGVGVDLKIIGPALAAILVTMAVVTTAATSPLLTALGWRLAGRRSRAS